MLKTLESYLKLTNLKSYIIDCYNSFEINSNIIDSRYYGYISNNYIGCYIDCDGGDQIEVSRNNFSEEDACLIFLSQIFKEESRHYSPYLEFSPSKIDGFLNIIFKNPSIKAIPCKILPNCYVFDNFHIHSYFSCSNIYNIIKYNEDNSCETYYSGNNLSNTMAFLATFLLKKKYLEK